MWDKVQEPQRPDVSRIAESILRLKPLAVVLTGGDPLFSPYLEIALESLRNKAGIIIDTSGYTMSRRHLELFKAYDVVVRISLDSQRPRANEKLRYLHPAYLPSKDNPKSTGEAALDAIIRCLDAGIPVTVQTVATKKNTSELVAFGDRLYRLGIRSWRVFEVVYSWEKREQYRRLVGPFTDEGKRMQGKKARGPYWFVFNEIHKANEQNWEKSIAVQTIFSTSQNSVLLVSADGRFFTASNLNGKKILIDGQHPTAPSAAAIRNVIEMQAHAKRYLNITGPGKEEE
jgi:sulfatase maturation enzyme AslB (radical SAM superfamily)